MSSDAASMQAVQLTGWGRPAVLREVPRPQAGPGEVLLEVRAAGLCHSDLHLMHWPAGTLPYELPFTLGHEVTGTVAELGPGANGVDVGDQVIVYGPWGCGACRRCSRGEEHLCEHPTRARGCGLGRDGGLAEYLVVPSPRLLVGLGDLDPVAAAPLADAALTPYHALRQRLPLRPGASVVVIGAGGLGHIGIQVLKAISGVTVVVVDRNPAAVQLAGEVGADKMIVADGSHVQQVLDLTGGHGAEAVLDFVGEGGATKEGVAMLRRAGNYFVVGYGENIDVPTIDIISTEINFIGNLVGSYNDLQELMVLAAQGKVKLHTSKYPLEEFQRAIDDLDAGRVRGRAILIP
jgi:NAD+-dependent secondary alcohol dehydrogenase Adh1